MQPSSLIFVAVVGIWAAFLVQHWVRRREDLATARSADRFSDAIRVLERRPIVSSSEARPTLETRLASLSPQPAPAPSASPLIARSTRIVSAAGVRPEVIIRTPDAAQPQPVKRPPRRPVARTSVSRKGMLGRRLRAFVALAALVAIPVTVGLAIADLASWWSVAAAAATLLLAVIALRAAAVRERTGRHTGAQLDLARASSAKGASATAKGASATAKGASATASDSGAMDGIPAAVGAPMPRVPEMPDTQGVPDEYERSVPQPAQVPAARPAVVAFADFGVDPNTVEIDQSIGLGEPWSPVAVPPPTYTLKDKAPEPVAVIAPDGAVASATAAAASDLDVPVRRAVGD
ncbi:MAG: hypothetical protein KBF43_08150 [Dermatophilaceae bacterium]|nr:hypothetical protein [Dermatophilaceae bacterium]